jgi:farnesyl diphosphate synthase
MFNDALADCRRRVAATLSAIFDQLPPSVVCEAMRYTTLNGGKRLRALLVMETARLFDVPHKQADMAAAAVELMHAYSLVHDDLPAMDNDALRRGKPTVHVKWDDATAILAGDGLQALSFEALSDPTTHPDAAVRLALIAGMAKAAGANGMVLGQMQDIAAETAETPLCLDEIISLQSNKTGALIRWSAQAGAILGGSDFKQLTAYADALGLAFQIADDILDVEGDEEKTGKRLKKDENAGKATFVSLLGVAAAKAMSARLVEDACDAISPYGSDADILRVTARFVIARDA